MVDGPDGAQKQGSKLTVNVAEIGKSVRATQLILLWFIHVFSRLFLLWPTKSDYTQALVDYQSQRTGNQTSPNHVADSHMHRLRPR
jgi:hypothetical protein